MITQDRDQRPYYLGRPLNVDSLTPGGKITTSRDFDSGVPDPAAGAEQDTGAIDPLAEIARTNRNTILKWIAAGLIATGAVWWVATKKGR